MKKLSPLDYDLPILNKALIEYMVHGIPVEKTIESCEELKEFQLVSKISSKYSAVLHGEIPIKEKCIRIFASTDPNAKGVKKISIRTGKPEKITNSPEHCFVYNDSVNGVRCPSDLDKQWYINFAKKRLHDFGVMEV